MKLWHYLCATTIIAGTAGFALPALAQDTTEPEALSQPGEVAGDIGGDIIVTANKRSQSVQDVPLAVSVVAPAQLAASGVNEFQDIYKVAPSLRISPAQQPQNANIAMRGVGTLAFSIGVEPSVAVLIDEVPLAFQARAFTELPDIERLEVLRGPQSTLYGKSASAGLINLITRGPSDTFEAKVNGKVTTDQEYNGSFSVSGPISDTLGYILSGSYSSWDGNVRNVTLNKDVASREAVTVRGKLRWEPTTDIAITLAGNYNDGSTHSGLPFVRMDPTSLLLNTPGLTNDVTFPGVDLGPDNQKVVDNTNSSTKYHGGGGYLRGEFGLGDMNLVSITSYDRFKLNDLADQDHTAAPSPLGSNVERGTFNSEMITQEIRLQSPAEKPFSYTVGLYYADTKFNRPFQRGPAFSLAHWYATAESRQIAAFAQADWKILPQLILTGGARLQNEKVSYTFLDIQNGNAYFSGHASDTADTYKASLRYEFTPDISVFGTFATGYKGQTYDLSTGFNAARAAAGPVKPETSTDWEIGLRSQFLDRALTVNVTLFDTKYKNLQAQSIETVGETQFFRLTNVGGLHTRGVEVDLMARPIDDLNLGASAAYLNAKYTSFPNAQCYIGQTAAQGCVGTPARQDLTGSSLPAPDWNVQGNADYSPSLTDDLRGILQASFQYQSASQEADPRIRQSGFTVVNLGVGVRSEDRSWEVVAFVNNLFDEQYYASLTNRGNLFGNKVAIEAILPRDFRRYGGVRFGLNF
ncbi:MAG TPA: TonB-dependent receptor [Novosphingobium sp.]|nr:TonB-dependent receptor [Novosphingobium sp.]